MMAEEYDFSVTPRIPDEFGERPHDVLEAFAQKVGAPDQMLARYKERLGFALLWMALEITSEEREWTNPIVPAETPGEALIRLPNGACARIDAADAPLVHGYSWWQMSNGYVIADKQIKNRRKSILLHRLIMDAPPGIEVDHKNGDTLDNRRSVNLRLAGKSLNQANRHSAKPGNNPARGVYRAADGKRFTAKITVDKKQLYLGVFNTLEEAKEARKKAEIAHWGQPCPQW